jgi:hypothetical protein
MTRPDPSADRLAIAEALYDYAEAMDLIGASPVPGGEDDPGLPRAMPILARCLTDDVVVRVYFEGINAGAVCLALKALQGAYGPKIGRSYVCSMFARMSRYGPVAGGTTRQPVSRFAVQPGTS